MTRCLISFSGGETSAYMTQWLLKDKRYDEYLIVFANTGQENDETLEFVHKCDEQIFAPLGHRVVWIESVMHPGEKKSPSAKVVTYETANRDGAVFEAAIQKYGIPNSKFKDCTRNLKRNPIESYARSVGWVKGEYDLAIGIREDETDRINRDYLAGEPCEAATRRLIYPLAKAHPMTKPKINAWWEGQKKSGVGFRLELKGYQGNCKWCWKKSFRKHFTLLDENPEFYDFPRRMEATYGLSVGECRALRKDHGFMGPEFRKVSPTSPLEDDYRRMFFRGNKTVADLEAELAARQAAGTFTRADDDAQVFDETLDVGAGCEESCEVFTADDKDKRPTDDEEEAS